VQDLGFSQRFAEASIGKSFVTVYQSTRLNIREDLNRPIEYSFETDGFMFSFFFKS
jgi:hypothetical protein